MLIEYKTVAVSGISSVVEDEGDGVVSAFVSVTGIEDRVNDIIEPGAYTETLKKRIPKGVWSHNWNTPTAKTLEVKELLPGDPELPATLPSGQPWPEEAGALKIKMQFNLATQRGREAHADVLFFGDQQEWSIGYKVPKGGAFKDELGRRRIKVLDLYEYSPVLFGAMPLARTASVKDAQLALKSLYGEDTATWEQKLDDGNTGESEFEGDGEFELNPEDFAEYFESGEPDFEVPKGNVRRRRMMAEEFEDDEYDEEKEYDDENEDEDDDDESMKSLSELSIDDIRTTIKTLDAVLTGMGEKGEQMSVDKVLEIGHIAFIEAKSTEYESAREAVKAVTAVIQRDTSRDLMACAKSFDGAAQSEDKVELESTASNLLDVLSKAMEEADEFGADESDMDSLRVVARVVADNLDGADHDGKADLSMDDEEDEDVEDEDVEAEDEDEDKSVIWRDNRGNEFKNVDFASRIFGMPFGEIKLCGVDRQRAFIGGLSNTSLIALDAYLGSTKGNLDLHASVDEELTTREVAGLISDEEKTGMNFGGRNTGRGGGDRRMRVEGRGPSGNPVPKKIKKAAKRARSSTRVGGGAKVFKGVETKRTFSAADKERLGKQGKAFKNANGEWSYPIDTPEDVKNAVMAFGRAIDSDKPKLKKYIMKRAKALGCMEDVPNDWSQKSEKIDLTELKSLVDFANNLETK